MVKMVFGGVRKTKFIAILCKSSIYFCVDSPKINLHYELEICTTYCETHSKYASKESHAFEAYCDVHLALKASPCGLAISGNNRLSL
jgi:hypothetical protein